MKIKVYHNPRWGKSRDSVRILDEKKIDYKIIEYLKVPLDLEELKNILAILNLKPIDIFQQDIKWSIKISHFHTGFYSKKLVV